MECHICGRKRRGDVCRCGYDWATGDVRSVVVRTHEMRDKGNKALKIGLVLLAIWPLALVVALPAFGAIGAFGALTPLLVVGGAMTAMGTQQRSASRRWLVNAKAPIALPPARVIE